MILSEYGCNIVRPRTFPEVKAIYSEPMTSVFAGAIAYQYTEEENHYGLVETRNDKRQKLPDYENFKAALASISPQSVSD